MGGVCSCDINAKKAKHGGEIEWLTEELKPSKSSDSPKRHSRFSSSSKSKPDSYDKTESTSKLTDISTDIPNESKQSLLSRTGCQKIAKKRSFLERHGIAGLERAAGVIDSLGSGMPNLNTGKRFIPGMKSRGYKISILAFEVANTIAKLATLLWSLSEENLKFLKKEILCSKGVRTLVSSNMLELLTIAASDKREELDVLSKEVIRFGNLCKDPEWHNLDRYISKLEPDYSQHKDLEGEVAARVEELVTLVRHTSELYHEIRALDIFEQDFRRKLIEVKALNLPQKAEGLTILRSELKQQRKLVKSLKKKSLWSKNLEEIMEKLVDAVVYIRQAIVEAFEMNGLGGPVKTHSGSIQRLGDAGLSLHYANLIQQLASIASRPSPIPPNVRNMAYNALPESVKKALRSRSNACDPTEKLSESMVKADLEETLEWLVPLALNTTKAYQGFGWVGEWANTRIEHGKGKSLTKLQTLYHADREKIDSCILEVITWLNRLVGSVTKTDNNMSIKPPETPVRISCNIPLSITEPPPSPNYTCTSSKIQDTELSVEERLLLEKVIKQRSVVGISKSFDSLALKKKQTKVWALSNSMERSSDHDSVEDKTTNGLGEPDGLGF